MKSGLSSWAAIIIVLGAFSVFVTQRLLLNPVNEGILTNEAPNFVAVKVTSKDKPQFISTTFQPNIAPQTFQTKATVKESVVEKSTLSSHATAQSSLKHQVQSTSTNSFGPSPLAKLKCGNQTKCLTPNLQLQKVYKVYYCKHINYGVRFFFLVKEGLLLHPSILLVSNPGDADVIIYLPTSSEWSKSECGRPEWYHKLVVLDEGDGQGLFHPPNAPKDWYLMYFKRSYVKRENGAFHGFLNYVHRENVFPMTYTVAEAYVRPRYLPLDRRDTQILCTLRGHGGDPVRQRVREWTEQYAKARGITKYRTGEVNSDSRTVVSRGYFGQMYNAQIIVTSNPSGWEGDFRLMEAFASGALIFVDRMFVPRPYPLEDWKHVIYYDNKNKTELFDRLDIIRANKKQMSTIAANGYLHAMTFHRAANLIDYVFRTLHTKELMSTTAATTTTKAAVMMTGKEMANNYIYTGYQLQQLSRDAADVMKRKNRSGRRDR